MWPYWMLYLVPATAMLFFSNRASRSVILPWLVIGVLFTLFIGYRVEVGGDWWTYLYHLDREQGVALWEEFTGGDPGYVFLNRLVTQVGGDIYDVNLISGAIFMSGLIMFCRSQPRPWLALAVAVPYLVIVMGMGYTRQGIALGLILWALTYLEEGRFVPYLFFVAFATLFHKTAVIMVPLGIFLQDRGWFLRVIAVGLAGLALWNAFVAHDQETLWKNYVEAQMQSEGALVRVLMNVVPGFLLLLNWKQWKITYSNARLWLWMALGAMACLPLVGVASTAVDRIALYLTPLQLVVFSRLPDLWRRRFSPSATSLGVVLGYAAVLFVWLNYATHAQYWLPYRNALFE